ncbi:uncharacterized protein LOC132743683 isoform X2 [Ruditapes philippinarum]|uniref:uncharacterized protein LOC132743683 isoform X2 n=1 Tax=Ruditapes philippinarum TaxID=129788 RepID=UPI00295BCFD2|nr:uncharacterized protein LOC132743683 isoform X2 [Ruditapes philippinarum]
MEIHDCVLIVFLLGFGVDFSTQNTKIQPELSEKKCYIKEIESFNPNDCSGVEEGGHTVRHQGGCIVDGDQTLTCVHGHWSGADSSVEMICSEPKYPSHSTVTCSDSFFGYQSICLF